jgi:hypothetical protein
MNNSKLAVTAAISLPQGFFLEVPDRTEDFWLFLSKEVGWVRFSFYPQSKHFGVVEVRETHCSEPNPVFSLSDILWKREKALEVDQELSAYHADLVGWEKDRVGDKPSMPLHKLIVFCEGEPI